MIKVTRTEEYIAHHGIKGQKWGVRNGPPYPLDDSDHSASEKRASSDKSASGAVLTTAAVQLAAIAAYMGLAYLNAKAADKRRTKQYDEEYYQKRKIKTLASTPRVDPASMTMDEHMSKINQDYPKTGTTENCMFCTMAMAMRMQGYEVAAAKCPSGWSAENLKATWDNWKTETPKCKTTAELKEYLKSQGNGAYGNMIVFWNLGGGHSMFYHVDNDDIKIYDTQSNKSYTLDDFNGKVIIRSSQIVRLDNCQPTETVLGAVTNVKEKEK